MGHDQNEKLDAKAAQGAEISREALLHEQALARGVYNVVCIGPREEVREQYVRGMERYNEFIAAGKTLGAECLRAQLAQMEEVKWKDTAVNIVVTVGKNLALDTYLAGSVYTVVGPYMFLASGSPGSATAGDTMATKTGWAEVGATNGPQYKFPNSGGAQVRATCAWSSAAAGAKALSAALSFYIVGITGGAVVAGAGLVYGAGATNVIDSTTGILYSVGAFTNGSKTVGIGDTLSVSYSTSL